MRIAAILSAAILALVVLAAPGLAAPPDGHGGGPPAGVQHGNKNKDTNDNNQGETNRFGAENAEDCAENPRNHGQYVSCVVHVIHSEQGDVEAKDLGLDSDCDSAGSLVSCAAQSNVGKDENGQADNLSADNDNENENQNQNDNND
jgi:hypothetical protein